MSIQSESEMPQWATVFLTNMREDMKDFKNTICEKFDQQEQKRAQEQSELSDKVIAVRNELVDFRDHVASQDKKKEERFKKLEETDNLSLSISDQPPPEANAQDEAMLEFRGEIDALRAQVLDQAALRLSSQDP